MARSFLPGHGFFGCKTPHEHSFLRASATLEWLNISRRSRNFPLSRSLLLALHADPGQTSYMLDLLLMNIPFPSTGAELWIILLP